MGESRLTRKEWDAWYERHLTENLSIEDVGRMTGRSQNRVKIAFCKAKIRRDAPLPEQQIDRGIRQVNGVQKTNQILKGMFPETLTTGEALEIALDMRSKLDIIVDFLQSRKEEIDAMKEKINSL